MCTLRCSDVWCGTEVPVRTLPGECRSLGPASKSSSGRGEDVHGMGHEEREVTWGIRRMAATVGHQSPGCSWSTDFRAVARRCSMALPSSLQCASIAACNLLARIPYEPLSCVTTFLHSQRLEVCQRSDRRQWCEETWENNRESVSCQNVALWARSARMGVQAMLWHTGHCLRGAMRIQAVLRPLALQ